ncbi:MAG: c-type cytochrome [Gemmatimonadetes bacterium]|nr:c-type cytochrome [Gemmatimonadota bacterium]
MWQTNLKIFLLVVGTLGLYTLVATSIPQVESEVPAELSFGADVTPAQLVEAGEELYNGAGGCLACHGSGARAPNLLTAGAGGGTIGQRCGERVSGQDCKTYLHESLVNPAAYVVEGFDPIMPDASIALSENQIWALVAYLQDQGGQVTVAGSDLSASDDGGATAAAVSTAGPATASNDPVEIMRSNLCMGCHTLGDEGVELGPSFDAIGAERSAEYLRRSILEPNREAPEGYEHLLGAMPATFGQQLTAGQLETLVQFLANRTGG